MQCCASLCVDASSCLHAIFTLAFVFTNTHGPRYPWLSDANGEPTFDWPTGMDTPSPKRKKKLSQASETALVNEAHAHETLQQVTKVVVKLGLYTTCEGETKCKMVDHMSKTGHPMFPMAQ
jgi:hypothetical protein